MLRQANNDHLKMFEGQAFTLFADMVLKFVYRWAWKAFWRLVN
jgi:hypothetical protein